MTELTQAVSSDKVSIKWSEEYVSRAGNRQASVVPPGLYNGGDVDYSTTTTLRIAAGTYVVQDTSNGFGLLLRDPDTATIDCSSLFPAASTKTWYVGVHIDYTTGSDTTCEYYFTDVTPSAGHYVGKDALVFAQVVIHSADTGLDQATISMLGCATPTAYPLRSSSGSVLSTDRELGLVTNVQAYGFPSSDEKDAFGGYPASPVPSTSNKFMTQAYLANKSAARDFQSVTISSNIKFQLSGDIYIGDGSTSASVRPWFVLLENVYDTTPYTLTDGSLVKIDYMKNSSDTTTLVPSTHADADGFYSNPWVYLTSSGGSIPNDTIACLCTKKVTIADDPTELDSIAWSSANIGCHSELSTIKEAGTDGSEPYDRWTISAGSLQTALEAILSAVNQTQVDLRSFASTSDFKRIFRGGTIAADSGIGAGTPSIYVSRGAWVALMGGYIDASGIIYSSPTATSDVCIFGGKSDGFFFAFKDGASTSSNMGSVNDIDGTESVTWDFSYSGDHSTSRHNFYGDFLTTGTNIHNDEVGTHIGYGALTAGAELSCPDYYRTWLTSNADYDPDADTFSRNASHGSMGVKLFPYKTTENYGPIFAACSSYGSASWSEGSWVPFAGLWSRQSNPMASVFADGGACTVANNSNVGLVEIDGLLMIKNTSSSKLAVFVIDDQIQSTTLLYGDTGFWDTTWGASGKVSVGYSGSNLEIYNKSGGSLDFNIGCFEIAQRSSVPTT
jgi:hypothetical protein